MNNPVKQLLGSPWRWLLAGLPLALPTAILITAGFFWLVEHHWIWPWAIGSAVLTTLGWWGLRWLAGRRLRLAAELVQPAPEWCPRGKTAWEAIRRIEERIDRGELNVVEPNDAAPLMLETIRAVAQTFHPDSSHPELEVPIPALLKIVERVAADVNAMILSTVPGSHLLTIADLKGLGGLATHGKNAYDLYRLGSFAMNPYRALVREAGNLISQQVVWPLIGEAKKSALKYVVRQTGQYAIDLYSGRFDFGVAPEDPALVGTQSRPTVEAVQTIAARERATLAEPFRIVLVGTRGAGKSSLVNALAGELKAVADPVRGTKGVVPYRLILTQPENHSPNINPAESQRVSNEETALIYDTAGLNEGLGEERSESFLATLEAIRQADAVILVCPANMADRSAERRWIDAARAELAANPARHPIPILVALTKIDLVRPFREWNPPYDLNLPNTTKAQTIRAVVEAVSQDLDLPPERIVPVRLDTRPPYNVREALWPTVWHILDAEGRSNRMSRVMEAFQDERKWSMVWEQTVNAGRVMASAALSAAQQARKTFQTLLASSPVVMLDQLKHRRP
ncbi:GTP-binding protein HSR1-related protein [Isosphaera pallida ATCC 43644]|uniref:GTP-binding protein HSR1-related protein n=1 Tax=Isosphaera pallida (strain ATCC 43644 / DSM 9630 / IS1B) TaxID=575540 RepID=E8R459_ISOPI|nr:GTPase domain-containing protein [Isosphaera pallida]ADV61646.1 GTP-binding protein HSR1-related protein [Isosphaera pallida ATCC 43644]